MPGKVVRISPLEPPSDEDNVDSDNADRVPPGSAQERFNEFNALMYVDLGMENEYVYVMCLCFLIIILYMLLLYMLLSARVIWVIDMYEFCECETNEKYMHPYCIHVLHYIPIYI